MNTAFKEQTPFQIFFIVYFNLTLLTTAILLVYVSLFDNFNFSMIFGWFLSLENFYRMFFGIGLLAFIQIIISILITIFVATNWIKMTQIIEPVFADLMAVFAASLYAAPSEASYYIGVAQILLAFFFVDFSSILNKFNRKKKNC